MVLILWLCKCAVWTKMNIHVHVVLLTLLSVSRPLAGCPSSCTCNITHSDCSSRDLHLSFNFILNQLPSNITTLNLSRDNITIIYPGTFANLSSLQYLDLSRNQLLTLEPSTFSQLSSLEVLDLSSNFLENLPLDLFSELEFLRELILRANRLKVLDPKLFQNLARLQHLDLSFNNLASLDSGLLDGVQGLEWLSLAGNKLRKLERQMLEPLTVLQLLLLDGNQWNCSCSLMPFRHWLEWMLYRGGHVDAINCSLPAMVQSHDLRIIPVEMFRHCSQLAFPNHQGPPSCIGTSEGPLFSSDLAVTCLDKRPRAMSLRRAPITMVLARLLCGVVWLMMVVVAMYGCIYAMLAAKHQQELQERKLRVQQQPLMEEKEAEMERKEEEEDEDQRAMTPELTEWIALPPEVCV